VLLESQLAVRNPLRLGCSAAAACYNADMSESREQLDWVSPPGKPEPLHFGLGGKWDVVLIVAIVLVALIATWFTRR
jgi:hypothetical protein